MMDTPFALNGFSSLRLRFATQAKSWLNIFVNRKINDTLSGRHSKMQLGFVIFVFFSPQNFVLLNCGISHEIFLSLANQNECYVVALWSCSHTKLSCDQQISQTSVISAYLHVLFLHLCPVCALKAMFPGLHTLCDGWYEMHYSPQRSPTPVQ